MTTQELEGLAFYMLPYVGTALFGALIVYLLTNRKKQPTVCPVPDEVIMEKLQALLADAFQKLNREAFLKEASRLYDTKATLARK